VPGRTNADRNHLEHPPGGLGYALAAQVVPPDDGSAVAPTTGIDLKEDAALPGPHP
jgi:hypothetical protein